MEFRTMRESRSDRIFQFANYTALAIFMIVILYPLIYIVSSSFSAPSAVMSGKVWLWPVGFSLEGYKTVFQYPMIMTGFKNSLIYTVSGTMINVALTLLAAYPLSRKDFFGRNFIMFLFVFTMLFSGGLIPSYLLVRDLGMLDTIFAMIIPTALTVWNVIIARTFFQVTIPHELLEAAKIDGSNDFQFFFKIVLPLSAPIIAVITLFYAVGHWNQYFLALIYLKSQDMFPLQLVLRQILIQNQVDLEMLSDLNEAVAREGLRHLLKYSLIIVASIPVLIIYPFVQKHFVKGVMIGSLKG